MRGDRKQVLLQVGEELFARHGYKDVGIEEIARAAGVGTGSFYTYFQSKEDFYGEILDRLQEQGRREVDRLIAGHSSALAKLKALYRFASLSIRRNPILLGLLTGAREYVYPGLALRREKDESLKRYIETRFEEILKEGGRSLELTVGQFRNPRRLALALFETVLRQMQSEGVEELLDDALHLPERGFGRRLRLRGGRERRKLRRLGGES